MLFTGPPLCLKSNASAACDMVELGSFPFPRLGQESLLSCDLWHAPSMVLPKGNGTWWGEGERLQGNTPLSHLMAELDATLKITAGLGFSPFLCTSLMAMRTGQPCETKRNTFKIQYKIQNRHIWWIWIVIYKLFDQNCSCLKFFWRLTDGHNLTPYTLMLLL